MKTADLDRALALARSEAQLNMADLSIFDGFALPDFRPVTCTVEALAMLVRWQCVCFDGSIDAEALQDFEGLLCKFRIAVRIKTAHKVDVIGFFRELRAFGIRQPVQAVLAFPEGVAANGDR